MIPKIKKVNLSTQLTNTMIHLIETKQWGLEMKLPNEIELAASFHVSRNIMRESMKILENFGILDSKTGIGTFVSQSAIRNIHNMKFFESLKIDSPIEQLLETRLVIEPELAFYTSLRRTEKQLCSLKTIVQVHIQKYQKSDYTTSDDFEFHRMIAKFSGNTLLENLLISVLDQLKIKQNLIGKKQFNHKIKSTAFSNHIQILEAIEKQDALFAKETMHKHLLTNFI